ncbi:MAG TPA: DEAD/DEAH box helicase [Vicinamibacterales bacterium]|nr:DEAD/DEAH box helicase [Vicinamibacterales bacterium]
MQSLPAITGDKDQSLQAALSRMLAEFESGARTGVLTADDDPHVTAARRLAPVEAQYAPFPESLDPRLTAALGARGIDRLYIHQAEVIAHSLAGRNVVIVTPTASGKTLCYNAPVLQRILENASTRALYLFPTKALAQDQLAALHQMVEILREQGGRTSGAGLTGSPQASELGGVQGSPPLPIDIGVFTYDGDTPQDARRAIRGRAHVVLSNPDMVHSGILPHHPRWAKLFENLQFIVVDELHSYRGVFGSHLANILRRLRRVCRHYGSDPAFICSSATIANPKELAERLTGQPFEIVDKSGAPRGEKFFLFVNPPVVNAQLGIRRSYLAETRRVAIEFLKRGLQMIVFAQSRLSTEILTTYMKDAFQGPPGADDVIRGYRGGYLPLRRREIERGLRNGEVRCVVSTNALELGIDIGALDVAVMAGYPGTIAGTWQRAGRAGRRSGRSAAVLVASSAPIDQFVARHPDYFFDASPEHALINPDNLHILLDHVKCAAFELPFGDDEQFGSINVQEVLSVLAEEGFVHLVDGRWQWTQESYPADAVSLRSVTSDNFVVVDLTNGERVIGETDFTSGPSTLHEKAIYIVEGQLFQVERFDYDNRKAFVRTVECDYYTDAITYTKVTILETFVGSEGSGLPDSEVHASGSEGSDVARLAAGLEPDARTLESRNLGTSEPTSPGSHGEVRVVSRVVGFKKIKFYTNENVGSGELDLPEQQMHTTSYWLTIPAETMAALPFGMADRRDGVVGMAFAMRNVAPLLLMCDGHDLGLSIDGLAMDGASRLGGSSAAARGGTPAELSASPTVFIYDNFPGGIGFSEPLYGMHHQLIERTRELIDGCPCKSGCPSCVGPEGATGPLAKAVASRLLAAVGRAFRPGELAS